MQKGIVLIGLLFWVVSAGAQNIYLTKDAKINFNSSTPLEDIVAESNQATTIIDIAKMEVKFSVLTTSFHFRRALMEEHFNENYMESSKNKDFSKAKFSGKFVGTIDWKSEKAVTVPVEGELSMHGVTKAVKLQATITPGKNKLSATAELKVTPEEFNIQIPSAVRDKIAKEVTIKVTADYTPYQP